MKKQVRKKMNEKKDENKNKRMKMVTTVGKIIFRKKGTIKKKIIILHQ